MADDGCLHAMDQITRTNWSFFSKIISIMCAANGFTLLVRCRSCHIQSIQGTKPGHIKSFSRNTHTLEVRSRSPTTAPRRCTAKVALLTYTVHTTV